MESKGHNSIGADQASMDHGADSYSRSSLSVTAANIDCHLSDSLFSVELSELADLVPF